MKRDVVLIISEANDLHARVVKRRLEELSLAEGVIMDSGAFPAQFEIVATYEGSHTSAPLHLGGRIGSVRLEQLQGVWWRRPEPPVIPGWVSPEAQRFCYKESTLLFNGLLHSLGELVVNPLMNELRADYKPFQLAHAARCGLRVPETIITNDPEEVRAFYDRWDGEVIFKILGNTRYHFAETRRLAPEFLSELERISVAPTIFQQLIPPGEDLRVTVVGEEIFPARMVHPRPGSEIDWRLDVTSYAEPYDLPPDLATGIGTLMSTLGLAYGALDFRIDPEGRCYFLEINPTGQFLFVEIDAGHPISYAMARLLARRADAMELDSPSKSSAALVR